MMVRYAFFTGASLLVFSGPAFAQADPITPLGAEPPTSTPEGADRADNTGELAPSNEIVVSARRREESVQDVPQTVNVVTSAQVEKLNLRNFQEIQSIVPGLSLQQTSAFNSQATVRGIAFVPEASGNNPSIEFYLNDAPISSGFLFQSTFDFGQFELQRGPQGTLRGRAAPSGAIAVSTRRPDLDEPGVVVNGTLTDLHARKVDTAFNLPVIEGVLGVRLAGVVDENEGDRVFTVKPQSSSPTINPDPLRRTRSLRASVLFQPTDWLTMFGMYQTLNSKSISYTQVQSQCLVTGAACPTGFPVIRPFDRRSNQDTGSFFVQQHDVYIGNVDVRFAGQRLSYVGSYNTQDYGTSGGGDPGDFFAPPRFPLMVRSPADPAGARENCAQEQAVRLGVTLTNQAYAQCTRGISNRESHEIRLASEERIAGIFDYVVGALYDRNDPDTVLAQETPLLIPGNSQVAAVSRTEIRREADSLEKSVFGNLTAHVGDRLELSGGLRYIDYEDEGSLFIRTPPQAATERFDFGSDTATVYTASVKYEVSDDINLYALTGTSFRPGPRAIGNFTFGRTGAGPSARELSFTNLPPEKSTSYEIGAKTTFLNGRGRFNIAAYHQRFKNYPFRGPAIPFVNYRQGIGGTFVPEVASFNFLAAVPVTVKGVEVEASFQILERWSLGLNAAYADGKIKNGTIACIDYDLNGVPDINPPPATLTPGVPGSLAPLIATGQAVASCPGFNGRSSFDAKFTANVQSEYGFNLNENVGGFVRGLYAFRGKNAADAATTFDDTSAFGLLNLYAGVRDPDGAWELTIFGKNILREREVLSTSNNALTTGLTTLVFNSSGQPIGSASSQFAGQYVPVSVTAPREFGITARIALGSR